MEILLENKWLVTLVTAMLPVVELRGAIPLGVSMGLQLWQAVIISIIGNLFPIPFIIKYVQKVLQWIYFKIPKLRGFVERMNKKADSKKALVQKGEFWGLLILVAIPLPGTGAWTGALVAALLNLRLKRAIPAIAIGVLIAAVIVSGITYGFGALFS